MADLGCSCLRGLVRNRMPKRPSHTATSTEASTAASVPRPRCRRRPPTPRPAPRGRGRVGSGHPPPICSVSPFDCYILVSRITRRFCSGRLIVAIPPGARQPQIALGGVSVARGLTGASIRGHIALPVPTAPSISRGGGQTHASRLIFGAPSPSRQRQIAWRGIAIGLGWAGAGTRGLAALPGP